MSFGRPGGALDSFRVLPPDRGSFPLDHDGEFSQFIYRPSLS
jgi:cytochrome c oxidase assembly protein subunit 19